MVKLCKIETVSDYLIISIPNLWHYVPYPHIVITGVIAYNKTNTTV